MGNNTPNVVMTTEAVPEAFSIFKSVPKPVENIIRTTPIFANTESHARMFSPKNNS